jgi:myo-inositol 2-dehydrogenase/D-chiro-inositol 1-dehydrogenase/scyllo-inositol 2-dehydrogenase (NAD+)
MTIKLCLVGGGRAAKVHGNSITRYNPRAEISAVVDSNSQTLKDTSALFGIENAFSSFEEALEKAQFDGVVISTPTFTHADLAVLAANSGKHIFLEKPMALTLEECDEIITAVKNAGVVAQLGFMRRFDPDFLAAEEKIRSGVIGKPMMIKSLTHGPGLPPPWARDLTTSNGNLAEVNSHDWDCVRWLMGSNPDRVYTEVANFKGEALGVKTKNFYDNALVSIRFQSGGLGSISGVCPCDYGYDARAEVIGEKGIMLIGTLDGQALVICNDKEQGLVSPIFKTWPERFKLAYINEMEHFVDCISNGTEPGVGLDDGRWAVACVLAATRSMLENRPVDLKEVM